MKIKAMMRFMPFSYHNQTVRRNLLASLWCSVAAIVLDVSVPFLFKKIVAAIAAPVTSSLSIVYLLVILYGSLWTVNQLIKQLPSLLIIKIIEQVKRALSIHLLQHLYTLSLKFHLEHRKGALTSLIDRAQAGVSSIFWGVVLWIAPTIIEMLIVFILLTSLYGIFYSWVLLFIVGCYVFFNFMVTSYVTKKQRQYNEKRDEANARIIDGLLNIETIKYFGNEQYDIGECNSLLREREKTGIARFSTDAFVEIGQGILIGLGLLYVALTSGKAVVSGTMDVSDFVLINGYFFQFAMPLQHFGYLIRDVRDGLNNMVTAADIMLLKPEINDIPTAIDLNNVKPTVVFDRVTFGYDQERIILKEISFIIPEGKVVAIVGPTGSGKSTIAKLLFRFYDVQQGAILINKHDLRTFTQRSLHAAIGVVPQNVELFNNTLYYNIAYGSPSASIKEVERAAHLAHLDSFIARLPKGYQTLIGDRGFKVSGGEKQRIGIARVLIKKPSMYIFDEATSSLDMHTEREIQRSIEKISSEATTLIISHRLSTIVHASEILVLDKGYIVERGTHHALLSRNGLYAMLWNEQKFGV